MNRIPQCITLLIGLGLAGAVLAVPPELGVEGTYGFLVYRALDDGNAAAAGIQDGDFLVEFQGMTFQDIGGQEGLTPFFESRRGKPIEIRYLRKRSPASPTFEEGTATVGFTTLPFPNRQPSIGVQGTAAFLITDVRGGRGKRIGLQRGDYLVRTMGKVIGTESEADWQSGLDGKLSLRVFTYLPNAPGRATHKSVTLQEE